MTTLSAAEAEFYLNRLPSWSIESGKLVRNFQFEDFRAALAFVTRVGEAAEDAGHHPDIDIRWNRVRLTLMTHDASGLTVKDFELAAKINQLV